MNPQWHKVGTTVRLIKPLAYSPPPPIGSVGHIVKVMESSDQEDVNRYRVQFICMPVSSWGRPFLASHLHLEKIDEEG